jgi:hypothetical protein
LQYRLAEATRRLIGDVRRRYCGSTDRLAAALESAAQTRGQTTDEVQVRRGELSAREEALRAVLAQLAAA